MLIFGLNIFTYLLIWKALGAICYGNMFVVVRWVKIIGFFIYLLLNHLIFLFILLLVSIYSRYEKAIAIVFNVFDFRFLCHVNIIALALTGIPSLGIWCRRTFLFILQNTKVININLKFLIVWLVLGCMLVWGVIHIF